MHIRIKYSAFLLFLALISLVAISLSSRLFVCAEEGSAASISLETLNVQRERESRNAQVFTFTMNDDHFAEIDTVTGHGIVSEDYQVGKNTVTIKGSFLAGLKAGEYHFTIYTVLNPLGFIANITIVPKSAQIIYTEKDFDKADKKDITFSFALREDRIVSVEGNGVTKQDYIVSNGMLTFKSEFLGGLPAGKKEFKVITLYRPKGISLTVNVNSGALLFARTVMDYRIGTEGVLFEFSLDDDAILEIERNGKAVAVENYKLSQNSLIIKGSYLDKLSPGEYTFTVKGLLRSVDIFVNVLPAAEFSDGDEVLSAQTPAPRPNKPKDKGCSAYASGISSGIAAGTLVLSGMILIKKRYNR